MVGSGLKKLSAKYGMRVSNGIAYGNLQGFAATLSEGSGYKQIIFATKFEDAIQKDALMNAINQVDIQRTYRVQKLGISNRSLHVIFVDQMGTMKKIEAFLEWFIPLLQQHGASGMNVCTECGCEIIAGSWIGINGTAYHVHTACAEKIRREIADAEQAQKEQSTGSYAMGALGAFLGAAVGAAAWALMLSIGFIASLVGLVIGWLAEKGYNLLKGKQGKGKIAILILAIIFGVLLGTFATDYFTLLSMVKSGEAYWLTAGEIPSYIVYMLITNSEYLTATISNIVMGLLFAGLGVFALLKKANNEVKGTKIINLG